MADDDNDTKPEEEDNPTDPVVENVKEDLKDDKGHLTLAHLKEMEERLQNRIDVVSRDTNKDAEEKAALRQQIETQQKQIEELIKKLDDKDKDTGGSSTIVVPPEDLPAPTHQNIPEQEHEEGKENEAPKRKRRMSWY